MASKQIITLSAKTKEQLNSQVQRLIGVLEHGEYTQKDFINICYTLQIGREHMNARLAVIADSLEDARNLFTLFLKENVQGENIFVNADTDLLFRSDDGEEELDSFMKALAHHEKFSQIAKLWIKGFDFDWEVLYESMEPMPHCVSLPSYPFEKEKFWVRDLIPHEENSDYKVMVYQENWVAKDIENIKETIFEHIVVISASTMELDGIKGNINAKKVTFVKQSNDLITEFVAIKEQSSGVDAIWFINEDQTKEVYHRSVLLLQSIYKTGLNVQKILVFGTYANTIEKAYLDGCIGFERSIKLIMPNTQYHVIGIEKGKVDQIETIRILWQEMCQVQVNSVLYEGGIRKVTSLSQEQIYSGNSILKQGGVYCIIGGMGGLGMIFSKWLLNKYNARLIIMGRGPKQINQIASLKTEGGKVDYIQANILDETVLEQAFKQVKEFYGNIDGVLNCAGLVGGSSMLDKSLEEFDAILLPNVEGTLILEQVAKKIQVGFITYFCSNAAILGDFGSCCYAVGKRFQQSFVTGLDQSLKRVVINWPLWKSDGMKLDDEQSNEFYMKSSGQKLMDAKSGTELFEQLLNQSNRQHLVFYAMPNKVANIIDHLNTYQVKMQAAKVSHNHTTVASGIPVEKQCITDLKELVFETIGLSAEKITNQADFAEMGFDSVELEDFVNRLNDWFGLSLAPDIFFNYPTVGRLGKHLSDKYREQLNQLYQSVQVQQVLEVEEEEIVIREEKVEPVPEDTRNISNQLACDGRKRISIVGMSGRYPDARNIDEFWGILESGKDVTREVIGERDGWDFVEKTGFENSMDGKRNMGVVPGIYEFDPLFFAISPREAEQIDPRQRLLLEETWKALEDAGYGRELLESEQIGVFVGAEESDYGFQEGYKKGIATNSMSALAGRIGYFLNLNGPNMVIDTACSSSLVAFNQACLSIESGVCDAAIVAGASILTSSRDYELMERSKMISLDGICHAFDKKANGMIPAEAISVIVLKQETKAKQDGHLIYGNVIGYGVNYDGKTNGLTAPSGTSQRNLIKDIYMSFDLDQSKTDLIVTHGTGTKLGDSIEINALSEAFENDKEEKHCALISFKPNIGHSLAASGLVSLTGLLLAMKYKKIPATIHCETVNEYINWDKSPFYLNKQLTDWNAAISKPRRAGISSFGITGTNAHVLIEEDELTLPRESVNERPAYSFCFSAKSLESLKQNMKLIKEWIKQDRTTSLADISFTMGLGRMHLQYRTVIIASTKELLIQRIQLFLEEQTENHIFFAKVPNSFEKEEDCLREIEEFTLQYEATVELYEDRLRRMAEYYCEGYEEVCHISCNNGHPLRVHMPTYSFHNSEYQTKLSRQKIEDSGEITFQTVIYEDEFDKE